MTASPAPVPLREPAPLRNRRIRISSTLIVLMALTLVTYMLLVPGLGAGADKQALDELLRPPSPTHPMGTDQLGRDQASRVAIGLRNSTLTMLIALAISGAWGGLVGLASGYVGGRADLIMQRLVDTVMAMPLLVLALAASAVFGGSFWSIAVTIGIAFSPLTIRVARSSALTLKLAGYVDAARTSGASSTRIVTRHLVPNALGSWAIVATSQATGIILVEAALAFLGASPGRITIGGLLGGEAQTYMHGAAWLIIWPGIALVALAVTVNLLGEMLANRLPGIGLSRS